MNTRSPNLDTAVTIDGQTDTVRERLATIMRKLLAAKDDIETGEPLRITVHCGRAADDVSVEIPKRY